MRKGRYVLWAVAWRLFRKRRRSHCALHGHSDSVGGVDNGGGILCHSLV